MRVVAGLGLLLALAACGPKYPNCETDEQCAEKSEVCVEGTCQQCRDDKQCAEGQSCQGGRCDVKPECAQDADCSDNKVCRSGKCETECAADADCGAGLKCKDARCVDSLVCTDKSDCAAGLECVNGRCGQAENVSRDFCTPPTVRFGFNDSDLTGEARAELQGVASCLKEKIGSRSGPITVEGHADERGTEEFNLALGDRRSRAVIKYLTTLGVPANKLRPVSKGEFEPVDRAETESAWASNRRVEFIE